MKNIQVIDNATNYVYDIFSASDEEFNMIFPQGTDIAFIDEVYDRENELNLNVAFKTIWTRRIIKRNVQGIDGILFYDNEYKKEYYPDRTNEGACNPEGSKLR